MTSAELQTQLVSEIKGLSSNFVSVDYSNACADASRETDWSFPVSGNFKTFWIKERAKRHLFFYLYTEQSYKFKFEQINLQHRFDHLDKMIEKMDKDFKLAQDEYPHEFANVSVVNLFGTKIDAGFAYEDGTGRDRTYDEDQEIIFSPTDSD